MHVSLVEQDRKVYWLPCADQTKEEDISGNMIVFSASSGDQSALP